MLPRRGPLRDAVRQGVAQGATLAGEGGGEGGDGGGVVEEGVGGGALGKVVAESTPQPRLLLLPLRRRQLAGGAAQGGQAVQQGALRCGAGNESKEATENEFCVGSAGDAPIWTSSCSVSSTSASVAAVLAGARGDRGKSRARKLCVKETGWHIQGGSRNRNNTHTCGCPHLVTARRHVCRPWPAAPPLARL